MHKIFPWLRQHWGRLNLEDKQYINNQSKKIIKSAKALIEKPKNAETVETVISDLCRKYHFIDVDCRSVIEDGLLSRGEGWVPQSDIEFICNYFQQFCWLYTDTEVAPVSKTNKKFRLKNDYWGELVGEVIRETDLSYYFKCTRDGEVVMDSWQLDKNSPRIICELW